jgi:hypothetical protein
MSFAFSSGDITPPLTAGGVAYGNGTNAFMTAQGTEGQILTSNGAGIPLWQSQSTPSIVNQFTGGNTPPTMKSSGFGLI